MSPELIKKIKESPYFEEFTEYILSHIDFLNNIQGVDGMSVERAGEEVLSRAKAITILEKILEPFMFIREKKEPTIDEIQKAKSKAGL